MCLICVEYYFKRMSKDEVKKALPEMIMFAKTEEEKKHFKLMQSLDRVDDLFEMASEYVIKDQEKNDKISKISKI